jgi:cephalosporin hydroxylase
MEHTMFDFSFFYDRVAKELPDNSIVCEVGVADGNSALYLANKINSLGKSFKLYMVDNMDYGKYFQMKTIYENIIKSGLGKYIEVVPTDSVKASKMFNGDSLDFVYLDSSHQYKPTLKEIKAWYPKLRDGALLSGHDFYSKENPGVQKAVKELLPEIIKRPDINEADHHQEFLPHQFLNVENTPLNLGVWYATKTFYFKP